ncbi:oxidoreductase [Clostridium bornimense]|uniref:Oxidoreductase n=1 Tax=Clostridium bornimense TaxID=1216932 RepID=W6S076_9CLOT|nr:Gfo/Idh/MocA family oxidoreductase [Clostridium bornimense]CDM70311.1 oxidoreductase [Clostridium bornimense]
MINLGIVGCSNLVYLSMIWPSRKISDLCIYGIASRKYEKAKEYGKKFKIPNVYENYDDMFLDENIDAVYICLPNHLHREFIIKAAEHKKDIIVEKPVCTKTSEINEIIEVCKNNNVKLMEAVMIRNHPWEKYISDFIREEKLGKILEIETNITFIPSYDLNKNYRAHLEYGGGCFFDVSIYWLQFLDEILGIEKIVSYDGESEFNGPNGIDSTFIANVKFQNGTKSKLLASFEKEYQANHILIFENGKIIVPNFFACNVGKRKFSIEIFSKDGEEKIELPPENFYENQLINFVRVLKGEIETTSYETMKGIVTTSENIYMKAYDKVNKGEKI